MQNWKRLKQLDAERRQIQHTFVNGNTKTRWRMIGTALIGLTALICGRFLREFWNYSQQKTVIRTGHDKDGRETFFLSKDGF